MQGASNTSANSAGRIGVHRQKNETGQHLTLHMEHNSKSTRAKYKDWNPKTTSKTHTRMHSRMHTGVHTDMHTETHAHAHTHARTHIHACTHAQCTHACTQACTQTLTHTDMHTHMHTDTHPCTHTCAYVVEMKLGSQMKLRLYVYCSTVHSSQGLKIT